jgi:hypothetical protein
MSRATRGAARLRAWWRGDGPALVPLRLWIILFVWPLALFAFFVVPEPIYLNTRPLFAATPSAPGTVEPAMQQQQVRKIAILTLAMEGETPEEWDAARDRRTNELRQRVGTNILHLSGYLADASLIVDSSAYPPQSWYALSPDSRPMGCASAIETPVDDPDKTTRAAQLAVALVAVEKFNRNALQRWMERTYAGLYRAVLGKYPDLSYGPAQIRPSLVRRLAEARPDWPQAAAWTPAALSDDQLLKLLFHECKALGIAATFALDRIVLDDASSDADIAAAYGGQRRRSAAPIDYARIVESMVTMMSAPLPEPSPPPTVEPQPVPPPPPAPSFK